MTGQEEFADRARGTGTFPQHWIASNIATDQELKRRGLDPAEVRSGKRPRTMSGAEALAKLRAVT